MQGFEQLVAEGNVQARLKLISKLLICGDPQVEKKAYECLLKERVDLVRYEKFLLLCWAAHNLPQIDTLTSEK